MAKLGPKVHDESQVECPILNSTAVKVYCTKKDKEIWIQIRESDGAEWEIVQTSFTRKDGDIRFKKLKKSTRG